MLYSNNEQNSNFISKLTICDCRSLLLYFVLMFYSGIYYHTLKYIQYSLEFFFKNLYAKFRSSYADVQWETAPTQIARASGKWNGGKAFSSSSRGVLSFLSVCQSLNASTGHNMRPFEIRKTSSESRKRYLSSDTDFQP